MTRRPRLRTLLIAAAVVLTGRDGPRAPRRRPAAGTRLADLRRRGRKTASVQDRRRAARVPANRRADQRDAPLSGGINFPRKVVLEKDGVTVDAVFRDVNEEKDRPTFGGGRNEIGFTRQLHLRARGLRARPHARPRQRAAGDAAQAPLQERQHPDLHRARDDREEAGRRAHRAAQRSGVEEAGPDDERLRRAHLQRGPQPRKHPDHARLAALDDRPHARVPEAPDAAGAGHHPPVRAERVPEAQGARREGSASAHEAVPERLRDRRPARPPQAS